MACRGLPTLCCDCRTCTHRRGTTSFTQVWSGNVVRKKYPNYNPECPAVVLDVLGVGKLVKAVEKRTGKPCGCEQRQERLNKLVPFGKAEDAT